MHETTVSDVLIRQLIMWGVKRVYAVAGDTLLHLFDRLKDYPELQLVTTRHESAAAFMASAEAKLTGQLTVCMGHNGPGVANLVNGLGDAFIDRAPVLVITGQVERWNMGTNYKQYIDQKQLLSGVTSFSELVADPESAVDILTLAMRQAISMGTVAHVIIPKDVFSLPAPNEPRAMEPFLQTAQTSPKCAVKEAIDLLNGAEKPVILFGRGCIMARQALEELAQKMGAGLIATLPARGLVPTAHPLYLGGLGHAGSEASTQCLKEADLAIILGATWWPYDYVPKNIPILQIDANPVNIGSSKIVTYGLVGKVEELLPEILEGILRKENLPWVERVKTLKADWEKQVHTEPNLLQTPLEPATVINELNRVLPADAIIILDVGDHVVWFNRSFYAQNQQILISGRWRSMGFGLPAAAAAALTYPEKTVVLITGDGGLSMVLGELSTLSRYNLPVKIFVLNNHALAMEKNRMVVSQMTPCGVDLNSPDFAMIARGAGLAAYTVNAPDSVRMTLSGALAEAGPVLVDIETAGTIPPHTKL